MWSVGGLTTDFAGWAVRSEYAFMLLLGCLHMCVLLVLPPSAGSASCRYRIIHAAARTSYALRKHGFHMHVRFVPAVSWTGLPCTYPPAFNAIIARMVHPDPVARPTLIEAAAVLLQLKSDAWAQSSAPRPAPHHAALTVPVREPTHGLWNPHNPSFRTHASCCVSRTLRRSRPSEGVATGVMFCCLG